MKNIPLALSLVSIIGLVACSTPAPPPQQVPLSMAPASQITQYQDQAVNEAASAYVSLYTNSIEQSLAEQKYKSDLAYRHLSAEACLDSRATRLLDKQLTREEKDALVLSHVSKQKLVAYKALSHGHFVRVNGLELFSCDSAGLKVTQLSLKS